MTSPRHIPIFDGHNDVLLRLYRRGGTDAPRAFLEGVGKGQLDLPMARQRGFWEQLIIDDRSYPRGAATCPTLSVSISLAGLKC